MAGLHSFFFNKNIVFPAQDEYSYFSADFGLNICDPIWEKGD